MTKDEAAIVSAYTGYLLGSFDTMHAYIEKVMGRPVWTRDLGCKAFSEALRKASKADFIALKVEE